MTEEKIKKELEKGKSAEELKKQMNPTKDFTLEELKKENVSLKKKLAGKDTYINTLKKELKSKSTEHSKTVDHG